MQRRGGGLSVWSLCCCVRRLRSVMAVPRAGRRVVWAASENELHWETVVKGAASQSLKTTSSPVAQEPYRPLAVVVHRPSRLPHPRPQTAAHPSLPRLAGWLAAGLLAPRCLQVEPLEPPARCCHWTGRGPLAAPLAARLPILTIPRLSLVPTR